MKRTRHKETPWRFNWRNPNMQVLRRPFVEVMPGYFEKREEIMDPDESQALARDSFKESSGPDWRTDPTYRMRRSKGRQR